MTATTFLTEPDYLALRRALESFRAQLCDAVEAAEGEREGWSTGTIGETEHLVEDEQRNIDSILSSLQRTSLRDVDAALTRFSDGTFGRCVGCGDRIPIERLEAMPAAANCVVCQGALERPG